MYKHCEMKCIIKKKYQDKSAVMIASSILYMYYNRKESLSH